ncbi:MAG: type II toxin-antitoxin system RelE/ParE family toxin [Trueperaceae bacterium]
MIRSIRHKGLRRFHQLGDTSKVPPDQVKRLQAILTLLEVARGPHDMDFPGLRLHPLIGVQEGFWAVRVTGNWRIIFRFANEDVFDVGYLDYH